MADPDNLPEDNQTPNSELEDNSEPEPGNRKRISREEHLIRYIAENLVNEPGEVSLSRQRKGRTIVLELNVASGDMGRVIGRSGRVANAMRSLVAVNVIRSSTHRPRY